MSFVFNNRLNNSGTLQFFMTFQISIWYHFPSAGRSYFNISYMRAVSSLSFYLSSEVFILFLLRKWISQDFHCQARFQNLIVYNGFAVNTSNFYFILCQLAASSQVYCMRYSHKVIISVVILLLNNCILFKICFKEGFYCMIVTPFVFFYLPQRFLDCICSSICYTRGYSYFYTTERLPIGITCREDWCERNRKQNK